MEQIAEVYARSLFEVGLERSKLDQVRDELGAFDDALGEHANLKAFFFSPQFSTEEKIDGLRRSVEGASPEVTNFLEALLERSRMPAIHRIRRRFDQMWEQENKLLPVKVILAADPNDNGATADGIAKRSGEQLCLIHI